MHNHVNWESCANGVWKTVIGQVDDFNPVRFVGAAPKTEVLNSLGSVDFPPALADLEYEDRMGKVIVTIPLGQKERIHGLGLQFRKTNHRGRTRYLRVNSDPKMDTGESHAPVPFYLSSSGYGVLFNTSRIVTLYCGSCARKDSKHPPVARDNTTDPDFSYTPVSDLMEAVIQDAGVEIYVFAGKSLLEVVQRYNLFMGGGVLPPRWGLGFWHRVPSTYRDEEVLEEAMEYRKREFPCDVIGLEPGWHSKSYPVTYEWSKERYPDPSAFTKGMEANGFKINLWEHAYVSPDAGIFKSLEPYAGTHTVWAGLAPDYSLPEAQEILKAQHRQEHIKAGASGYKLDECDGSELTDFSWMFPAHAEFPSGRDGEQMRQMYGLLLQKMTAELFREAGRRTYGLVRASNTAASSLPYVVYSDLYDHGEFIRALCNASFCGLLWTPEVRGASSGEEWARRFQTVCFSPLAMINAWCDGTKPWSFEDVQHNVKDYVELRMRLLPYFYSAFARYCFEGIPPFRAMHLEEGFNADEAGRLKKEAEGFVKRRPWDVFEDEIDNQYMAGDSILVAPLLAGQTERLVYLPEGKWYDFVTAEEFQGGRFIRIRAGIEKLPLFVKDGAIIPMMPVMQNVPGKGQPVPLEVRHYGGKAGEFLLFDDDGETFAFEQGEFCWHRLQVKADANGKLQGTVEHSRPECGGSYGEMTWRFMK